MLPFHMYDNEIPKPFQIEFMQKSTEEKPHMHDVLELLYFKNDHWNVFCNGENIHGKPGDIVVLNSNMLHYVHGCDFFCVKIHPQLSAGTNLNKKSFKMHIPANAIVSNLFSEIEKEIADTIKTKSRIYYLIAYLLREHQRNQTTIQKGNSHQKKISHILKALEFISLNYNQPIAIAQLAQLCNLNEIYFCTLFKRLVGATPIVYTNKLRCEKAANLLENTDLEISVIARQVGIGDANYFSRTFKKYMGISPTTYKHKHTRFPAPQKE